ncbi:unnamed protein product [Brachionus calyciflorus]|uniref:TIR domain-containing protein n=1 Tax=Brachionus calyciflorus TaxID=104777 RepID=A0A813VXJ4_9BILA|nr:unnamed protein product [Brachionus calyciflorus]
MISYNSKSRPICLNIKKELEKNGYKVWIDFESIYGSSLEAMANAIETSFCVLMCITENYKESNFCRLEAEYCVQKNCPFVPLILQKGYRPNGWLGIILGTRIFIDFTKYDFEKAMFEVNRNLTLIKYNLNKTKIEIDKTDQIESMKNSTLVNNDEWNFEINWNEKQVEDWLRKVQIDQNITKDLIPCNGQVLNQLYMILKWNPEFYYQSLKTSSADSIKSLKNLAIFTNELKKLFEKQ